MRTEFKVGLFLIVFLFNGCATQQKISKGGFPRMQKIDIDGDGIKEIIKVEDDTLEGAPGFIVTITRPDRGMDYPIPVSGEFIKMELVELSLEGGKEKHLLLFYRDGIDQSDNLVIYRLSNDRLLRVFAASSICGIDMDFGSVMARVKIDKPVCVEGQCNCDTQPNWETWVWAGQRFIRDLK